MAYQAAPHAAAGSGTCYLQQTAVAPAAARRL